MLSNLYRQLLFSTIYSLIVNALIPELPYVAFYNLIDSSPWWV
jgi:hypothetical protein